MRNAFLSASLILLSLRVPLASAEAGTGAAIRVGPEVLPTLQQGTQVLLQLDQVVDPRDAKAGQRIAFEVSREVLLGGRVIVPEGASALGTITQASRAHMYGKAARVSVDIDAVRLPNGQIVPLSISPDVEDNGKGTRDDGILVNLAPAAAKGLLPIRRQHRVIPVGTAVRAYVRRDTAILEQMASVSN